jgi:hypothetical protein
MSDQSRQRRIITSSDSSTGVTEVRISHPPIHEAACGPSEQAALRRLAFLLAEAIAELVLMAAVPSDALLVTDGGQS